MYKTVINKIMTIINIYFAPSHVREQVEDGFWKIQRWTGWIIIAGMYQKPDDIN